MAYDIEGTAARLRAEMGEIALSAAWNEGQRQELDTVVTKLLAEMGA